MVGYVSRETHKITPMTFECSSGLCSHPQTNPILVMLREYKNRIPSTSTTGIGGHADIMLMRSIFEIVGKPEHVKHATKVLLFLADHLPRK